MTVINTFFYYFKLFLNYFQPDLKTVYQSQTGSNEFSNFLLFYTRGRKVFAVEGKYKALHSNTPLPEERKVSSKHRVATLESKVSYLMQKV